MSSIRIRICVAEQLRQQQQRSEKQNERDGFYWIDWLAASHFNKFKHQTHVRSHLYRGRNAFNKIFDWKNIIFVCVCMALRLVGAHALSTPSNKSNHVQFEYHYYYYY